MTTCDICKSREAIVDAKLVIGGSWANLCEPCFILYGSQVKGLYNYLPSEPVIEAQATISHSAVNEVQRYASDANIIRDVHSHDTVKTSSSAELKFTKETMSQGGEEC